MEQIEDLEQMRSETLAVTCPQGEAHARRRCGELHRLDAGELPRRRGHPTGNTGIDFLEPDLLREIVVELDSRGFSCHFHAIGDAAVRSGLDAVEAARLANGWMGTRHTICHIQVVHPEDIPRFRRLGVVANAQRSGLRMARTSGADEAVSR